jgi:hypothetical protein
VPYARSDILLACIVGGEFDETGNASGFCGARRRFLLPGHITARRDQQQRVRARERRLHGSGIREIADKDMDSISKPCERLLLVAHEGPGARSPRLIRVFDDERSHIPTCASDEIRHGF